MPLSMPNMGVVQGSGDDGQPTGRIGRIPPVAIMLIAAVLGYMLLKIASGEIGK